MSNKRLWYSVLAVFVFIFLFEWLFHGMFLKGAYQATSSFWRTPEEMQQYMPWMIMGQLFVAFFFCFIFTKGYESKGFAEGLRYGLLIAFFMSAPHLIMYAVSPLPWTLYVSWVIGILIEFTIAGLIVASVYKPSVA